MTVVRRLDTPESVAFWETLTAASQEVKGNRHYHLVCDPKQCNYGNGRQTCDRVILANLLPTHPDDYLVDAWELMTTGGVVVE